MKLNTSFGIVGEESFKDINVTITDTNHRNDLKD